MTSDISCKKPQKINSLLGCLDPRAKLTVTLLLVTAVIFTPPEAEVKFLIYFLFIIILILLARIQVKILARRLFFLLPLLLFLAVSVILFGHNQNGRDLSAFWNIAVKTFLSFLAFAGLSLTTNFFDFIKGLEKLRLPNILIQLLTFGFRYSFLLNQEAERLNRARESRSFGKMKKKELLKVVSQLIPHLFFRTFARSERVYAAMLARGYEGKLPGITSLKFKTADILFISLSTILLTASWIWL